MNLLGAKSMSSANASSEKRSILIIDDELAHTGILSELLSDRYEILTANDGETGIRLALLHLPDLVLLDVRLPKQSGLAVCSSLRGSEKTRDIPIIIMTGHDNQEARTMAYRMGADDYVSKPFALDEVLARIESKIRRLDEKQAPRQQMTLGNLTIDRAKMEASVNGATLMLSALEFKLLEYFVENREQILSRDRILEDIWKSAVVTPRTVDTHVSFLRKKLADSTYAIRTLYGAGYILKPREGLSTTEASEDEA